MGEPTSQTGTPYGVINMVVHEEEWQHTLEMIYMDIPWHDPSRCAPVKQSRILTIVIIVPP